MNNMLGTIGEKIVNKVSDAISAQPKSYECWTLFLYEPEMPKEMIEDLEIE